MRLLQPFALIALSSTWTFSTAAELAADAGPPNQPAEVSAYKDCTQRAFAESSNVGQTHKRCELELDAVMFLYDEPLRNKLRHHVMMATEQAMFARQPTEPRLASGPASAEALRGEKATGAGAPNASYQDCAARVFATSSKVADVHRECGAEMRSFIDAEQQKLDDRIRRGKLAHMQREVRPGRDTARATKPPRENRGEQE